MTGLMTPTDKTPLADTPGESQVETETPVVDATAAGRPTYSAVIHGAQEGEAELPQRRVHVVHNGDTLGRLAKRYLGDEARGLEIFDLNRDVLSNPHLLPIGAELQIPDEVRAADRNAAD
jgi:nucleoid-associated protein YgaU